jgi:hypothetical protein
MDVDVQPVMQCYGGSALRILIALGARLFELRAGWWWMNRSFAVEVEEHA